MEGYNNDRYNLAIVGWFNKESEVGVIGHVGKKLEKVDNARKRAFRGFEVKGEDVARFSA